MLDATPLLRLYADYRRGVLGRQRPAATQARVLARLIARARATAIGRAHDFARVRSVDDFRRAVPLRRYEDFWRDYWQKPFPRLDGVTWPGSMPYFAVTSGTTTGVTKYIPCSRALLRANTQGALDVLVHHLASRPSSRVFGGKNFLLGGSTALTREAPGVASGDLSGIEAATMPLWARPWSYPPREIALEPDWRRKVEALTRLAPKEPIRSISGTTSWLLVLFDHIVAANPGAATLAAIWPGLELVVHGGVSFAPYRGRFHEILAGGRVELREVYAASEGFIAVADRRDGEGLRLVLDHGLFFEFVPVAELDAAQPTAHWVADAETDVDYALVVTTCAGLWRYVLGDTVRLITRDPPRVVVTGRTSYSLSAFGEHLIAEEVEESVAKAAEAADLKVADYAVGAVVPARPGDLGHHRFVVEFAPAPPTRGRIEVFAAALDQALAAANDDYRAHRAGGFGFGAPSVLALTPGAFAAWLASRGQLGGQHKVPRLIADRVLLDGLLAFVETQGFAREDATAGRDDRP